jgi:anti-sigma-K factor RskA
MMETPLPDNWQDLLAGYVLGNLTESEEETFVQLLSQHPELEVEVFQLQETMALLPQVLPKQEPPAALKQKIRIGMQAIADPQSPITSASRADGTLRHGQNRWVLLGGIGAIVVLAGILLDNFSLRQRLQVAQNTLQESQQNLDRTQVVLSTLQQPDLQVFVFEGIGEAKQASASLMLVPGQRQVTIVSHNLPALTEQQVYRLWAVSEKVKTPVYCGEFTNKADRTPAANWSIPDQVCISNVTKMLITRDRAADPPLPRGTLLLQSKSLTDS